jgi:Leucine-rich repeat (LRR) protein
MKSRVVVVLATIMLILPALIFWMWLVIPIIRVKMLCPATCTCDTFDTSIDCTGLSLSNIPDIYLTDVVNFVFNKNNLTRLRKDSFLSMGLTELKVFTMANCNIVTVEPGAFSGLTNMIILILSNNTIREIKSRTFQNMSHLNTLYLDNNAIETLQSDSFSGLIELYSLRLDNNEIQYLPTDVFSNLLSLHTLALSYNMISKIKSRTFENMSHLDALYLNYNAIETLEQDSFSGLINLQLLWMDNNKLQYIPTDVFLNLPRLEILDLSYNLWLEIPKDTPFIKSPSLKKLSMHNCNISSLSAETFANVTALEVLELDSNGLRNFDVNIIKILWHLSTLHLVGNPLKYVSQFKEVLLWGQDLNITISSECDEPECDQFTYNGDYSNVSYEGNDSDTYILYDTECDNDNNHDNYYANYIARAYEYSAFLQHYVPLPVFVAVFTFGAAGNVTLLLIIIFNREMRTLPNMYIFNLALSDLISLIINMPTIHKYLKSLVLPYNDTTCQIFAFFIRLSVGLSAYFLSVLSIQRYHVTVNPLQYRTSSQGTWRVAVATVCGVWILAAVFAIPTALSEHADIYCFVFDNTKYYKRVVLFELLVSCILPLCVIVFSYVMTARHIMKSALPISDGVQHPQGNARKNTAKIVLGLSIVFVISYVPYHIIWVYHTYHTYDTYDTEQALRVTRSVSTCLLVFNSCFNPVALCCTSSAFRRHFKRCLMCYCKR